jgi:hypothetical protein
MVSGGTEEGVGEAGFFNPFKNHDLFITSITVFLSPLAPIALGFWAHAGRVAASLAAASRFSVPNERRFALVKSLALILW